LKDTNKTLFIANDIKRWTYRPDVNN